MWVWAKVQDFSLPFGLWPVVIAPGVRLRMLMLRSLKSVTFPFFSFYECGVETLSLLHHVLISVLHLSMN